MRFAAIAFAAALFLATTSGAGTLTARSGILGTNQGGLGPSTDDVAVQDNHTSLHIQLSITAGGSGCTARVEHLATESATVIWTPVSVIGSTGVGFVSKLETTGASGPPNTFDVTFIVPYPAGRYRTNLTANGGGCILESRYILGPEEK